MTDGLELSAVLSEFARTMVTDFPIQAILDHLVKRIVTVLPISGAGVSLISPGTNPRYLSASDDEALRFEELQASLGQGPCLLAYHSGKAVLAPNLPAETRFAGFVAGALNAGLAAVFAFPLRHGDLQLGALDLYRHTVGDLSESDQVTAQTLADVAAAYILNAQARVSLQESSDRSLQSSLHDPLTGLPNRVLLMDRLHRAFLRGRRTGKTAAVLFVDLDKFKAVNDAHGHAVGDQLLVAVTERLTGLLRIGDSLARLSGDEFVVLCEDLETDREAIAIADRLADALRAPFQLDEAQVVISASVGLAYADRGRMTPEELLHDADTAMYHAKRDGGARWQVFDPAHQDLIDRQSDLARDLHGALADGQLHTAYQPIVRAQDGRVIGMEALLRWNHPTRGAISPTTLIPIAETSGLITEIGAWVLRQACSDRMRWQYGNQGLTMSVNVSAHQLMSPGFVGTVREVLAETGSDPALLTLEVTESVFVSDSDRALIVLTELKRMGLKLALDDFGTGYSSLSYLLRFPIDIIKIDRSFITELGHDEVSDVIIRAVVDLAHGLGMTVVAEGVETADQHLGVTELGCDSCQGYRFARPLSEGEIARLLRGADVRLPAAG